jgi:hypothetical protein
MRIRPLAHLLTLVLLSLLPAARLVAQADSETVFLFRNGDQIHGRVVGHEEGFLLVQTAHFGVQRIALSELQAPPPHSIPATPADPAQASQTTPPMASPTPAVPGWHATLERIRRPLRFWHAGINISLEAKQEDIRRSSLLVELRASHEFEMDEVHGSSSYERVHENDKLTTDIAKLDGYWRHDLTPEWFGIYVPYAELNRNYNFSGERIHYLLTQQELGFGRTFLNRPNLKLRAGVAENFLNLWVLQYNLQAATTIESAFSEADLQLPHRIHVTDRLSYYYAVRNGDQGQKNEFEVTKDLTDNFKIRLRHEYRRDLPMSNVSNINLWRLVFGLEY